ncbi:MAG: class I SAM-dependent methyltransferase [Acidobacteriota bacterium]|jgi:ubiquinone/menaquinone biosynthesis C-methylase UbiE|nr:class I SAM-dependent methyltransferase [Acidobacteriota bacterium]
MKPDPEISEKDRELFDRIASEYERKDLSRGAARARRLRLTQTLRKVPSAAAPHLLEVGCGAGYAARYLQGRYASYTGIDHSGKLIDIARQRHPGENIRFIHTDLMDFSPGKTFDLALMIGVLHHLEDIPAAVRKVRALLKPGGYFVVNEPQPANPLISFLRWIRKRVDPGYSRDQRELPRREIEAVFRQAGFLNMRSFPQGFLSTPFAEVPLEPGFLFNPVISAVCLADRTLEKITGSLFASLAWNVIVIAEKP